MHDNERKQQLSIAYVHAVAAKAGYSCQREAIDDDSVDIQIGARGYIHHQAVFRSPKILVQLKATSLDCIKQDYLAFALPLKNYNDLRLPSFLPRYLFVLQLPPDEGRWLEVLEEGMMSRGRVYWTSLLGAPQSENKSSVTIRLPKLQRLTVEGLQSIMQAAALENRR